MTEKLKKNRLKINPDIEAEVLFAADMKCCFCKKRGDQIHHIDYNPSNNTFDNLVLLCFEHHNEVSVTNNLRKKPSPKTILRYRDHLYKVNENLRKRELGIFNKPIKQLTEEHLLTAALNANVIVELIHIKHEFFVSDWEKRHEIMHKLYRFSDHSSLRISYEVYTFLLGLSYQTRSKMPSKIASTINGLIISFFPRYGETDMKKVIELSKIAANISFGMFYDATKFLNNLSIAGDSLLILKYLNQCSIIFKSDEIKKIVLSGFSNIRKGISGVTNPRMEHFKMLIKYFEEDLKNHEPVFPIVSDELDKLIEEDEGK